MSHAVTTTYRITNRANGSSGTTTDAELADTYGRRDDYRVTAVTGASL